MVSAAHIGISRSDGAFAKAVPCLGQMVDTCTVVVVANLGIPRSTVDRTLGVTLGESMADKGVVLDHRAAGMRTGHTDTVLLAGVCRGRISIEIVVLYRCGRGQINDRHIVSRTDLVADEIVVLDLAGGIAGAVVVDLDNAIQRRCAALESRIGNYQLGLLCTLGGGAHNVQGFDIIKRAAVHRKAGIIAGVIRTDQHRINVDVLKGQIFHDCGLAIAGELEHTVCNICQIYIYSIGKLYPVSVAVNRQGLIHHNLLADGLVSQQRDGLAVPGGLHRRVQVIEIQVALFHHVLALRRSAHGKPAVAARNDRIPSARQIVLRLEYSAVNGQAAACTLYIDRRSVAGVPVVLTAVDGHVRALHIQRMENLRVGNRHLTATQVQHIAPNVIKRRSAFRFLAGVRDGQVMILSAAAGQIVSVQVDGHHAVNGTSDIHAGCIRQQLHRIPCLGRRNSLRQRSIVLPTDRRLMNSAAIAVRTVICPAHAAQSQCHHQRQEHCQ